MEKEDILGCIMYTLVRYKLDEIGNFLQYLNFLFGKEVGEAMREKKVDCFRTDIEAAYQIASQEENQLNSPKIVA